MALLILLQDGSSGIRFRMDKPRMTIGRGSDNDIVIDDELVSKQHSAVEAIPQEQGELKFDYYVQDLESTNHTYVNDEKIKLQQLLHGDVLRIGRHIFKFVDDVNDDLDVTTQLHKTWIPGIFVTKKGKKK